MENNPTLIPVVAAALIAGDGRVLLQKRRAGAAHGGLWEFPGGKIEHGESPQSALVRELAEELGIAVKAETLVPLTFASDPAQPPARRQPHVILLYTCRTWQGVPQAIDADAIDWFAPDAIAALPMPPLDYPLAEALKKSMIAACQA